MQMRNPEARYPVESGGKLFPHLLSPRVSQSQVLRSKMAKDCNWNLPFCHLVSDCFLSPATATGRIVGSTAQRITLWVCFRER